MKCLSCKNKVGLSTSTVRCQICNDRLKANRCKKLEQRKALGICSVLSCSNSIDINRSTHKCSTCLDKEANKCLNRQKVLKVKGLCRCSKPINFERSNTWCTPCLDKEMIANHKRLDTPRGKAMNKYTSMRGRCYNKNNSSYHNYGAKGVTVCEEWLGDDGFNNFFEWFKNEPDNDNNKYQLDKDILCNELNIHPTVYSPRTCQFVSRTLNNRNLSLSKRNTSGYIGVQADTRNNTEVTWFYTIGTSKGERNISSYGYVSAEECAIARDNYIIDNNLQYTLNNIGGNK